MDIETQLDANQGRRMAREAAFIDRANAREAAAELMIGELVGDGKVVYYIAPVGGRYREGGRVDLVAFLVRNNYV